MCGIVGMLAAMPVNQSLYDALVVIQHRGQDAAGIMTSDEQRVYLRKANGLVRDVVKERHMLRLKGHVGIGHVRYPTAGSHSASESQPFYVNSPYGLGVVHNGNLVNTEALALELQQSDLRHLNTKSDSEVLLNVLAHELQQVGSEKLTTAAVFQALTAVYQRLIGAYSVVVMIQGYGLLAFRDPHGIRPLAYGQRDTDHGKEFMCASETIALDALGFKLIDDVQPGQAVFVDLQGVIHRHQCVPRAMRNPCIFEFIYLARPDSVIDKIPVYQSRLGMGRALARQVFKQHPRHDIDVVIPIPETSRTAALALAQELGVPYSEGFVKNRYIGRTFIMPGQSARRSSVRMKLNAMREEFSGRNVLLVDDSIVRGTTSKEIIQMARDAGAKKVYFASAAPEVRYPNVYGIDMPSADELIARQHNATEIAALIGADWLVYQDLSDVYQAINAASKTDENRIDRFEDSIFTNDYITGHVDQPYLEYIAQLRRDGKPQNKALLEQDDPQDCSLATEE